MSTKLYAIKFFGRDPLTPPRPSRKARLSQRIDQGVTNRGWTPCTSSASRSGDDGCTRIHEEWDARGDFGGYRAPLMTQFAKPSSAADGMNARRGRCKKISIFSAFQACSHASTSPAADAITQAVRPG